VSITPLDSSGSPFVTTFEVDHVQVAPIREPVSMGFLGSAFVGVVGYRLRKRRKEARK